MYRYHWEKIDVGHYWDLKGTAVYRDKDLYKYLLLAFLAAYCASLAFLSSFSYQKKPG